LDRRLIDVPLSGIGLDYGMGNLGSSENWHLYYKLRQSYGYPRLLHEAPGHLFLGHESEDLTSFLQIAMLNGWGGYILTQADYLAEISIHGQPVVISHYAMRVWNRSHHGAWQLYGHSHGNLPDTSTSLSMDVGVDTHDFRPWHFDEINLLMTEKAKRLSEVRSTDPLNIH
jgi:hypothetical protein